MCSSDLETLLRKRQIGGNAQDDGILNTVGRLVELAYGSRAGRRIDARKNVQNLALAGKFIQADIGQIAVDQRKSRRFAASFRERAMNLNGVAAQRHCVCHDASLSKRLVDACCNKNTDGINPDKFSDKV